MILCLSKHLSPAPGHHIYLMPNMNYAEVWLSEKEKEEEKKNKKEGEKKEN